MAPSTETLLAKLPLDVLRSDIRTTFSTDGDFGPNIGVEEIGNGQGYVAETFIFRPDWSCSKVPKKLVIKLAQSKSSRDEGSAFDEVFANRNEEERDNRLAKYHNLEVLALKYLDDNGFPKIPKIVSTKQMLNAKDFGYVVMDFVDNADSNLHMCDNIPEYALDQVLQMLAKIQSFGHKMPQDLKETFKRDYFTDVLGIIFEPNSVEGFATALKKTAGENWPENTEKLINVMKTFSNSKQYIEFANQTNQLLGMEPVLVHGDTWMCNCLFNTENPAAWNLEAVIDFQCIHMGNAAADLVRLFAGCISGEDRRKNGEKYLRRFYGYVVDELGEANMPYTVDQLITSYHRLFALASYVVCGSIGVVGESIVKKSKNPKAFEILQEKQKCLIEDIISEFEMSFAQMNSQ